MDTGIVFTPPLVVGLSALGLKGDEDDGWDELEGSVVGWLFVVQRISLAYHSWNVVQVVRKAAPIISRGRKCNKQTKVNRVTPTAVGKEVRLYLKRWVIRLLR